MAAKYKFFILAFVLSLGLDQATKVWARQSLAPKRPAAIVVVNGYFDLRYSENPGSAFGMFRDMQHARILLFAIGIGALIMVGSFLRKAAPARARLGAELGLLAGGALGNIIDRMWIGKVTDFIVWKVGTHEWPTFNIADAALVIGVIGYFFDMKDEDAAKASARKESKSTSA
jgi:signal peptidase II